MLLSKYGEAARQRDSRPSPPRGEPQATNMKTELHALAPALARAPELAPPLAPVVAAAAGASVKYQDSQEPPVLAPAAAVAAAAGAGFSVKYQGRTMITCKSAHGRRESATERRRTIHRDRRQLTNTPWNTHTHKHYTSHSPASSTISELATRTPRYLLRTFGMSVEVPAGHLLAWS